VQDLKTGEWKEWGEQTQEQRQENVNKRKQKMLEK
jgi:hypothetical protein